MHSPIVHFDVSAAKNARDNVVTGQRVAGCRWQPAFGADGGVCHHGRRSQPVSAAELRQPVLGAAANAYREELVAAGVGAGLLGPLPHWKCQLYAVRSTWFSSKPHDWRLTTIFSPHQQHSFGSHPASVA